MPRIMVLAGIAIGAVLTTGAVTVAFAAPSASNITRAETHRFDVRFSPFFLSDLDRNGRPSKGDQIAFNDQLLKNGRRVGQDGGSCTIVENQSLFASCTGTIALTDGQITFSWLNSPPPRKRFAVTGGTGRYQNVRGEGTLVEFGNGRGTMTLRLIP